MMLIKPWLDSGFSWEYVLGVWSTWQTFNAGMIAFLASVIALFTVKYKESVENESKLVASKAVMPSALVEIVGVCESNFKLLSEAYLKNSRRNNPNNMYIEGEIIVISNWSSEVLRQCIVSSKKEDGKFIAGLLSVLQVNFSRLQDMHVNTLSKRKYLQVGGHCIENQIIFLGRVLAKVNRLFPFARMEEEIYKGEEFKEEIISALFLVGCNEYGRFSNVFEKINKDNDLSDIIPDSFSKKMRRI